MTNDEMMAFIYSVDLCFNVNDLGNLKPVLRRGVARQKEFFHVFIEQVKVARAGLRRNPIVAGENVWNG